MPFHDLKEESFTELYKEILNVEHSDHYTKVLQLKVLFEIARELRDLNRRLQDGIYIEDPEEMTERIRNEVANQIASKNQKPTKGDKE